MAYILSKILRRKASSKEQCERAIIELRKADQQFRLQRQFYKIAMSDESLEELVKKFRAKMKQQLEQIYFVSTVFENMKTRINNIVRDQTLLAASLDQYYVKKGILAPEKPVVMKMHFFLNIMSNGMKAIKRIK